MNRQGKKIRIFLGAWVNYTNAQNLNCLALAKYLDKEKFEVLTGVGYNGRKDVPRIAGLRYFKTSYPFRVWAPLFFVYGILWCDVAYLPKPECWRLCRLMIRMFRKKSFSTIEGVIDGVAMARALETFGSVEAIREYYSYHQKMFSITRAMIDKNRKTLALKDPDGVLYLGTEYGRFAVEKKVRSLTDVILIGADLQRKGIDDYLELAKLFSRLRFHVAGGGVGGVNYRERCEREGLDNVVFHGRVEHDQLRGILKSVQLHILPSRAEGFPKVTLETAAAGVPSLVYDDYGADEWITTGKDGFVVNTLDEMATVVRDLLDHPGKLQLLADNARTLAKRFDWKVLVKDWEREIQEIATH